MNCEFVDRCGFFRKFKDRHNQVWKSMVTNHCERGHECARRIIYGDGNKPPSDDYMPVGVHASRAFLALM